MEQIPSREAYSQPDIKEIPRLLWSPKDHCRVHKILPPIPSQMDPIHTFPPYFPTVNFNRTGPCSW